MNLFKLFTSGNFEEQFEKALEKELSKPKNENEIYNEICDCYRILLSRVEINGFASFRFSDYENHRKITVDNREYDLDATFGHDDTEATELLFTVDCLLTDLENDPTEAVLKKIEGKMNQKI
ncbi:MAG: hypothetical protein IKL24_03395 [Clostridia bacterium]|nr:hypothetical protein [Clostridia bacterium]